MDIRALGALRAIGTAAVLASAFAGGMSQAALVTIPASALNNSPGVYTSGGYYTTDLGPNIVTTGGGNASNDGQADGRNDDGFMSLNLGFNVTFFSTPYSSLFINNNGNISFGSGISQYIPSTTTGVDQPIISPFFGDVDTRTSAGVVHYNLSTNQLIVTWDQVGWYGSHATPTDSFQLVLRGDAYTVPSGEGSIGFFYQTMGWEVTDTSTVAAVGFGDGSGEGEIIAGSAQPGMAAVVQNKYIWFDANLVVVPPGGGNNVPEPASILLVAAALAGVGAATRKSRRG